MYSSKLLWVKQTVLWRVWTVAPFFSLVEHVEVRKAPRPPGVRENALSLDAQSACDPRAGGRRSEYPASR